MWKTYSPCSDEERLAGSPRPSLVFHVSFSSDGKVEDRNKTVRERSMNAFRVLPTKIQNCFDHVAYETLHLGSYSDQHEEYLDSTRLMFEELLDGKVTTIGSAVSYCLYMEPDSRPVQSNWLSQVMRQVEWPIPVFWVKGSIFQGNLTALGEDARGYPPNFWHINGNAIYNVGSEAFRNFYHDEVRRDILRKHGSSLNAFDTDFYDYILDLDNFCKSRGVIHLFQYTDVILNMWHTEYSVQEINEKFPNTILVHGGVPKA